MAGSSMIAMLQSEGDVSLRFSPADRSCGIAAGMLAFSCNGLSG